MTFNLTRRIFLFSFFLQTIAITELFSQKTSLRDSLSRKPLEEKTDSGASGVEERD